MAYMIPEARMKHLITKSEEKIVFDVSVPLKRYFRSGKELLRMANVYRDESDDERAFQLYMRYITLFVQNVPQHPEYKSADPAEKRIIKDQCKEIFPILEKLKANLKRRYAAQYRFHLEEEEAKREAEEKHRRFEAQLRASEAAAESSNGKFVDENVDDNLTARLREAQERFARARIEEENNKSKDGSPGTAHHLVEYSESHQRNQRSVPWIDRSTKPAVHFDEEECSFDGMRKVIIPSNLIVNFLNSVEKNTRRNVETCGILAGKLSHNRLSVTHVLIPKQKGTSDSCQTENEEQLFDYQDEHDLMTFGWIHTHPTQSAFMSSIDLHTHCSYQLMLPEAIAIVCAPKFDQVGLYTLTRDYGLQFIASCSLTGFHPHPSEPPLYQECEHVAFEASVPVNVVDLR
ncbi:STAM-binding protein [Halotydeus destructor]|nr:STAM-binding protein [Halotydeus destructor]